MENKLYLRFHSGSGHIGITGEVCLSGGDRKTIAISPSKKDKLSLCWYETKNTILLPYFYDAGMEQGKILLEVICAEDARSIKALTNVDNIKIEKIVKPRTFIGIKLGETIRTLEDMEQCTLYQIPVSNERTTNGIIIPYNSFSIQPMSIFDDKRLNKTQRRFVKEAGTSF